MANITQFFPAGILVIGAAVTYLAGTPQPTPLVRPLTTTVPASFLGVSGKDLVIGDDEIKGSGVSNYLNREFDLGGVGPASLYVGYHATQQGDKRMHSPTLCLPGSGWNPSDARVVNVSLEGKSYTVNRYVLQKSGQRILVYYWFQGRGRVTAGETALKLNAFKDALFNHRDEEALVRIIVPIPSPSWQPKAGETQLIPDTVAVQLAQVAIPAVRAALPPFS